MTSDLVRSAGGDTPLPSCRLIRASAAQRAGKVACLVCGVERHPANMCQIAESVEGDMCEYYCQECRWGL